jgi:hypothetical protein
VSNILKRLRVQGRAEVAYLMGQHQNTANKIIFPGDLSIFLRVPNKIKIPVMLRSYATKNLRCFASTPFRFCMTGASFC